MSVDKLLDQEIETQFKALKEMEVGTDQYKVAVDNVAKLIDRKLEMNRIDIDADDKLRTRESEEQFKQQQLKEERKRQWITIGLKVVEIGAPICLAVWGTKKSFEFEKEGTITTILGRGFVNKLLPKK